MRVLTDYDKYFNKGNDCDICKNQYICGKDGDGTACKRLGEGLTCEFCEVKEEFIAENELKPCPYCGGEGIAFKDNYNKIKYREAVEDK